jgi:phosphatidylserine/phosphatidylglycerophosphate/cardiolipin synthase-like enzyme
MEPVLQRSGRAWDPWVLRLTLTALALGLLVAGGLLVQPRGVPPAVLLDGPAGHGAYLRSAERLIAGAQQRIRLTLFVARLDDDGPVLLLCQALAAAAARGVEVRVMLDAGKDRLTGEDDRNRAAVAWFTARGVRVDRDEPDVTSHGKVLVVDGRQVLMGSHNWTRSALTLNREATVQLDDPVLAAQVESWLDR